MSNRTLIILFILAIVVIAAFLYFFGKSPSEEATIPTPSSTTPHTVILPPVPNGDRISIGTSQGSVLVKNFYSSAVQTNSEGDVLIARAKEYDIVYLASNSSF